ncbi:MAG: SDR family oxidoreductase [Limnohabitans sp.]|nr:MAG: SDR family oxidoreductase [Limnohabitans sp.]
MDVLVVTGAGRGIGAATALLAARQGYAVCVNYLQQKAPAQAVVEAITAQGGTAVAVQADVSQEDQVHQLFEAAARLGTLRGLVNNAGILERQARVQDMDAARIARVLQTNVVGSFLCAGEAVRRMSSRLGGQGGAIVNVSSRAARLGAANEYVDYAASKAAVDALTVGLAKEVAAEGIRVNAVAPGLIETDIHASGGEPGRVQRLQGQVPMQRGGQAEEVAQAILWLLSDQASYTTGAILDVSGGR